MNEETAGTFQPSIIVKLPGKSGLIIRKITKVGRRISPYTVAEPKVVVQPIETTFTTDLIETTNPEKHEEDSLLDSETDQDFETNLIEEDPLPTNSRKIKRRTLPTLPCINDNTREWESDHLEAIYICQHCDRSYCQRSSLLAHQKKCIKMHPRELPMTSTSVTNADWNQVIDDDFMCNKCGRLYCQRSSLLAHKKICGKDAAHQCQLCSYTTSYLCNMKQHIARKHHKEEE